MTVLYRRSLTYQMIEKDYKEITPKEIKDVLKEYEYDSDIMNDEDPRVLAIKEALAQVPPADKIMFCMYLELGSSRRLGKFLGGISHSTVLKEIKRIKNNIISIMDKNK